MVTFFVSLMAEIAEAVSLCRLVESYLKNENQLPSRFSRLSKLKNGENINKNKTKKSQINDTEGGYTIHETNY